MWLEFTGQNIGEREEVERNWCVYVEWGAGSKTNRDRDRKQRKGMKAFRRFAKGILGPQLSNDQFVFMTKLFEACKEQLGKSKG